MLGRETRSIHPPWSEIVAEEQRRHPGMTVQDLYKLVAQACLGGDHLLRDAERYRADFLREWEQLGTVDPVRAPAVQIIHPAGAVARLHLASCRSLGLSAGDLLPLLLAQPMRNGSPEALAWSWASILHSARSGEIAFAYESVASLAPALSVPHHSPDYSTASYRILNDLRHRPTRSEIGRLGLL